jgi:hypothetical protein
MAIEGEMGTIERGICLEKGRDLSIAATRHREEAIPIETMMDKEEVHPLIDGSSDGSLTGVDCPGHPSNRTSRLDLKSIQRMGIVRVIRDPKDRIKKLDYRF